MMLIFIHYMINNGLYVLKILLILKLRKVKER